MYLGAEYGFVFRLVSSYILSSPLFTCVYTFRNSCVSRSHRLSHKRPVLPMGSMHSKLQLLKYPQSLRIVIPSGNLVSYDWGETGVMENTVFLIDLPHLESSTTSRPTSNTSTLFKDELFFFLRAQGLEESLVKSLDKYDFSATAPYGFIHSM